jgi:hypothetical protein
MKKFLLILSVFALFSASLFATSARIDGLGFGGAAWMVQDQYLAYKYFPQMVSDYNNSAVLEAGAGTFGYVDLSALNGVVGILANTPSASVIANNLNNIGAIYSMGKFGFGVTYGMENVKTLQGAITGNSEGSYTSNHEYDIGIMAGYTLNLKKNTPLDIGLNVNIPSNYNQDNETIVNGVTTAINQTGTTGLEANLDAKLTMQNDMLANINVEFIQATELILAKTFTNAGVLTTHTEDSTATTTINLQLGGAKIVKIGIVNLYLGVQPNLSLANSLESNKNKMNGTNLANNGNTASDTTLSIPLYAGVEGKINDTWTIRGGVNKSVWSMYSTTTVIKNAAGNTISNINTTTNTIISDAPAVALGLSGTFGDVTLDTVISTGNTFLSQIALTYAWK